MPAFGVAEQVRRHDWLDHKWETGIRRSRDA